MQRHVSIYVAQDWQRLVRAEKRFGRLLGFRAVVSSDSESGFQNTSNYLFFRGAMAKLGPCLAPAIEGAEKGRRKIWWSIPGFWEGGNWKAAAQGQYNAQYKRALQDIMKVERANGLKEGDPVDIRFAFEQNGFWFAWSVRGDYAAWQSGFNHFSDCARSVYSNFRIEIAPTETTQYQGGGWSDIDRLWPREADRFHVVGLDHYWKPFEDWTQWGRDPEAAFEKGRLAPYGLEYVANVARQFGKPIALSEVGWQPSKNSGREEIDTRPYARRYLAWVNSHNVENTLYWNGRSNEGYLGEVVDNNAWPKHLEGVSLVLNGIGGTFTLDGSTAPVNPPPPTTPPVTQPADPVQDLLGVINAAAEKVRGRYGEPTNGAVRRAEHQAWVALVAGGRKAGTLPAGEETSPIKVLRAIYVLFADAEPREAEAQEMIGGWMTQAEPLLAAAGMLPEPSAPGPEPEPSGEVEQLQAKLAAAERRATDAETEVAELSKANAALQARIKGVMAALGVGQ